MTKLLSLLKTHYTQTINSTAQTKGQPMKINYLVTLFTLLFFTSASAENDCTRCIVNLSAYNQNSSEFRELAMLQRHSAINNPGFFTCQDGKFMERLKKDENWHLRDKDCKELERIFANRELHRQKDVYTRRLRAVYCGNSIMEGNVNGLKSSTAKFKADGDLAYYLRRKEFRKCESDGGINPLYDLGKLSSGDAERILKYLVFEEKIDLNGIDGRGMTLMDWSEDLLKRMNPGTQGYELITTIRRIIRDPRLGERKAKFSCEIMGECTCVNTFGHMNNHNCPPSYNDLAKLGSRKHL